jgi:hypothetical protein
MKTTIFNLTISIITSLLGVVSTPADADLTMPREGWVSWRVPAVSNAPNWCCFGEWRNQTPEKQVCQLDGADHGYGVHGRDKTTDAVRIYARFDSGKLRKLRAFAADCPVNTATTISKLEVASVDESALWLRDILKAQNTKDQRRNADVMAALAIHKGNLARDAIADFARNDANIETRKDAMFWLTQVRGEEGASIVAPLMFSDPTPAGRTHAGFAIAQSKLPLATANLIRQGANDPDTHVRAQAWFWLSQTAAPETEAAIRKALQTEVEQQVREQAIFALSQLPSPRAAAALIGLAEDRALAKADRKKAIFWLGQSKSDAAVNYFNTVLAATAKP